jgi:DNA-binding response OmpR family regulator
MKARTDHSLLIIEDDDLFRETFIDAMALRGVKVEGSRSGKDAIERLKDQEPSAIIIDVQLPDIHGFDLCKRIKTSNRHKKTPVIFLSASAKYNDPRDRGEGFSVGASVFLAKPITIDKLWTEIDSLI